MTNDEMRQEINAIVGEYLETPSRMPLTGWTKARLQERLDAFREMIRLMRECRKLRESADSQTLLYYSMCYEEAPEWFTKSCELRAKAEEIWFSNPGGKKG